MKLLSTTTTLLLLFGLPVFGGAFNLAIDGTGGISLTDVESGIGGLSTLHTGDSVSVDVTGISWVEGGDGDASNSILTWTTFVNGNVKDTGTYDLSTSGALPPSSISVGTIAADSAGWNTILVELQVDGVTTSVENSYQTFAAGLSLIPIIVILLLAMSINMVEIALTFGIWVGACMVTGNMKDGFFRLLDTYILGALIDEGHGFVFLFTFFLSGVVGMMEKSGGFAGFSNTMRSFATTARAGQIVTFLSGLVIFFDDYANALVVGGSMRPLTDLLSISREKLAFIVDATSAPIASIVPMSSWIGFEIGLIQDELDKLSARNPDGITLSDSGMGVFLRTIVYRYYPLFMLFLMPTLILLKRDYGPMLIAERKTQIYNRKDGGDGQSNAFMNQTNPNKPSDDTPPNVINMLVPLFLLIGLMFYLLIQSGDDGSGEQSLMDKFEGSDSYVALLYSTMASALLSLIYFQLVFKKDGRLLLPTPNVLVEYFGSICRKLPTDAVAVAPLMSVKESVDAFVYGMSRVFPAAAILTLAWASGTITSAVGTDRLFAAWITGGLAVESLPTISFVISLLMALATGTSWGTMAIVFPLIVVPTYDASGGDDVIVYATIAGILSGSVAGDHVSPISDTTVLSSLATGCDLVRHVSTQAPYVVLICLISILVGTIPSGYSGSSFPTFVSFVLGYGLILLVAFGLCKPVVSKTGNYDFLTELYLKFQPGDSSGLVELKMATAAKFGGKDIITTTTTTPTTITSDDEDMIGGGSKDDLLLVVKQEQAPTRNSSSNDNFVGDNTSSTTYSRGEEEEDEVEVFA